MDRFVTRAPSWKTANYDTVVAQSTNKRPVTSKSSQSFSSRKKPLQQKQLAELPSSQHCGRRLSEIFRPVHPITSTSSEGPTIENYNVNSNDSGLSSGSSISPPITVKENVQPPSASYLSPSKKFQTPKKNHLGKLGDYVDCPEDKENDTCMTITRTLSSTKNVIEPKGLKENLSARDLPQTPNSIKPITDHIGEHKELTPPPPTLKNTMLMSRIQRDLNSPSASVRIRALKALSSPNHSPYSHFDVPEAEQSLHLSKSQDGLDLKDIMSDVVVYVEVRSGEDDRSEGIRKVIEALGARVNRALNKDTTHVIFKEGRLSTFKKAQQNGIPVVSILWIEACKKYNRICDPKDFPISNLDRYENPELYSKMKVFRHMQPGSECSRRKVKTPTIPKTTITPTSSTNAVNSKNNTTVIGDTTTPTSSSAVNKKKTDISQYFKKIENSNKIQTTPTSTVTPAADIHKTVPVEESPATQLLKRLTSDCYTPLQKTKSKAGYGSKEKTGKRLIDFPFRGEVETQSSNFEINIKNNNVKKALDFFQTQVASVSKSTSPVNNTVSKEKKERSSSLVNGSGSQEKQERSISIANDNVSQEKKEKNLSNANDNVSQENKEKNTSIVNASASRDTSSSSSRRRSISTVQNYLPVNDKETNDQDEGLKTPPQGQKRRRCSTRATEDTENVFPSKTPSRRRRSSVHTPKNMTIDTTLLPESRHIDVIAEEDAPMDKKEHIGENNLMPKQIEIPENSIGLININANTGRSKAGRKRSVYSYKAMNDSGIEAAMKAPKVTKRRHTNYSLKSMETQTLDSFIKDFKSKDNSMTTKETNVTISQKSLAINENADLDRDKNSSRRSLYTPTKTILNYNCSLGLSTDIVMESRQSGGGVYLTPTSSNSDANVAACSTLLESADKPPKLLESSPATAANGKLVEETDKSATPYVFSSSRQPGNKRRTLFDVSMDIITQRLQCINQSARRSLNPSAMENIINNNKSNPEGTANEEQTDEIQKKPSIISEKDEENDTPDTSYKKCIMPTDSLSLNRKKRKLFAPNEPITPPVTVANRRASLNASALKTNLDETVNTKRRRTILPASQPTTTSETSSTLFTALESNFSTTPSTSSAISCIRNRRSTLDFEEIKCMQNKNEVLNSNTAEKPSSCCEVEKPLAAEDQNRATSGLITKVQHVLVYTNMHKEQIEVIREAVKKFSNVTLEQKVTGNTTHLISLEPRRTMNLLRALVRGLWILDYSWIIESMEAGFLLPEEPFELQGFSRSIEISRSERQAFGSNYKCELFNDIGLFYISLRCYPVRRDDLIELITLAGGHIAPNRNKARYIIGDPNAVLEDKIYVTPYWVLDSISQMQVMKVQKYLYPKSFERPEPSSPMEQSN